MNLYKSKKYINDLDYVIENTPILDMFKGTSVFITGGTGLICSAVVDILFRYNEKADADINVYIAGRSETRVRERFSKYICDVHFHFVPYDATEKNDLNFNTDYIIHGASNSAPRDIQNHTVDTMLDNFTALYELLIYAQKKDVRSTLFISSSEIYGNKPTLEPYREEQYGYVDLLNPRSSYSSAKRAGETLCSCFSFERNVHTVIVRPGHIYGPTAKLLDSHVSSQFAFSAAEGRDLILKSSGMQMRSYCYSLDAATAILTVLVKGDSANAYNISNNKSIISIKTMAELLARAGRVGITIGKASEIEQERYNPMRNSSLDGTKLERLGWHGLFDAETGMKHTVEIIKEIR